MCEPNRITDITKMLRHIILRRGKSKQTIGMPAVLPRLEERLWRFQCHPILLGLLFCIIIYVYTTSSYEVLLRMTFVGIELSHIIVILHIYDACWDTVKN